MTPPGSRRPLGRIGFLLLTLLLAAGVRVVSWPQVFAGARPILDGTDGYYHLRRAYLTALDWPRVIQRDQLMSVPEGARIQWPPLLDFLLGSLAKIAPGAPASSIELLGAFLPVALGLLQILALYWLLWRLAGPTAAGLGALLAAVLPGAVRYSLLGALDHDPLIELATLLVLVGLAGAWRATSWDGRHLARRSVEIAVPLTALMLSWAGAVIHVGLFAAVATATALQREPQRRRQLGSAMLLGSALAALWMLPFVTRSVWSAGGGATFAGLSWLQEAAVLGLAVVGGAVAWPSGSQGRSGRWVVVLTALAGGALLLLAPRILRPLLEGMAFLAGSEPFLGAVAESRPLLYLFGELDPRPLMVRLTLIPLGLPILLPWLHRSAARGCAGFLGAWALYTLAVSLVQARYSHGAALAMAAVFGVAMWRGAELQVLGKVWRLGLATLLVLLPASAAYWPLPGFDAHRLVGRTPVLSASGYEPVCRYLESAAPAAVAWRHPEQAAVEAVLAPWEAGHWIHWLARKATVVNPFGPQGQPGYADGVSFYFLDDDRQALELLERRRVRWVVVDTDLVRLEQAAWLAGLEPTRFVGRRPGGDRFVKLEPLMRTIGARLAFHTDQPDGRTAVLVAPDRGLREVFRSARTRPGPFGPVPWIRVYELGTGSSD